MPNSLPIPPELQHLIEKRSGKDRRKSSSAPERQSDGDTSASAAGQSLSETGAQEPPVIKERRSGRDRRRSGVRGPGAHPPGGDPPSAAGGQ